jgi:sulfur-oxidizing protein SoxA
MKRALLAFPLALLLAGGAAAEPPQSGFALMAPETQAMQRDDTANPGMLWVQEGEALWAQSGCTGCHGDAPGSMRGAASRYPAWDATRQAPIDLAGRIEQCRVDRQGAAPLEREGEPLLALSAYVAHQSRGLPIDPPEDPRLAPARALGEALFRERRGQLDLSCAQCHDDNAGRRLGGSPIPQGHPTGYPLYRLEWQGLGSLQRRLRNCMAGVRSEPYAYGAPEYVAIEAFLMVRARGLALETPAVRP